MGDKYFNPQKDITAYELAFIFAHVGRGLNTIHEPLAWTAVAFVDEVWDALPPEIKRHFADEPMPKL